MARLELEVGTDVLLLETGDALLLEIIETIVTPSTLALSATKYIPVLGFGIIPQTLALVCSFFAPTVTATEVALYSGMMKLRDSFKIVQRRRTVL